jgi:hypothetical protein
MKTRTRSLWLRLPLRLLLLQLLVIFITLGSR